MPRDRTANLLGALALRVTNRMSAAIEEAAGLSESDAAALSALHHFLDRPPIERLRQVLGLTHSGTVRLVDRLESSGYVTRASGSSDGRATEVRLTGAGRRAAQRVAAARADTLEDALGVLDPRERASFEAIVSRLLVGLMTDEPGAMGWMCRLCDTKLCGHDDGTCPVTRAQQSR